MPFKSKAQMRRCAQLVKEGKMTQAKFDEWAEGVDLAKLPEKATQKTTIIRRPRRVLK